MKKAIIRGPVKNTDSCFSLESVLQGVSGALETRFTHILADSSLESWVNSIITHYFLDYLHAYSN